MGGEAARGLGAGVEVMGVLTDSPAVFMLRAGTEGKVGIPLRGSALPGASASGSMANGELGMRLSSAHLSWFCVFLMTPHDGLSQMPEPFNLGFALQRLEEL